ncbi:alpha/beta hydrolase [Vulgatibacter incomptus]|uniref:Serine esterase, putative n=1 Tax=Vulgatibacter incomptus TaxID=1391653 RepID=A0A0K1PEZ5_9BACT|nr:alpha/beta hydrolase-fold protein [Vulgatibacter incomptus]AKU92090.1 serine esterase, putative [Vulgatibacter incomptus]
MRKLPFVLIAAAGCAAGSATAQSHGARGEAEAASAPAIESTSGRLSARPTVREAAAIAPKPGVSPLELDGKRDGRIFIPKDYRADRPAPLIVLLHGAGADGASILGAVQREAERAGAIVLAPDARGATWDVLRGGFGPDVRFIDEALRKTFERYSIDPSRVALAGFSDGGSYALSLGQANGDLFGSIIAFSPGFSAPPQQVGKSRIFVSHGVGDGVLPIDPCSRTIVPRLRGQGYDVRFVEFDGGHSVPASIAHEAMTWWTGR